MWELLNAVHILACPLGASAAQQTFTLTPTSYSHSTSTSLHSIGLMNLQQTAMWVGAYMGHKHRMCRQKVHHQNRHSFDHCTCLLITSHHIIPLTCHILVVLVMFSHAGVPSDEEVAPLMKQPRLHSATML